MVARWIAATLAALAAWTSAPGAAAQSGTGDDEMARKRRHMVETQIERRGVADARVLEAMRTVERHHFVPDEAESHAYEDTPLRIGHGQTISQPYIVALMTEVIAPGREDRVLEIGTGSGYQAAVLSLLVAKVYTIEIVEALGVTARERLERLGYDNVEVRIGDGYLGWPEEAPFDKIIVTAAPEKIPPKLIEQLADGGRMVLPVGSGYQELVLVEKDGGKVRQRVVTAVRFVPMVHGKEAQPERDER
jgi:protein-L-isoaspartate(D-aspartate) O-methyltransferase